MKPLDPAAFVLATSAVKSPVPGAMLRSSYPTDSPTALAPSASALLTAIAAGGGPANRARLVTPCAFRNSALVVVGFFSGSRAPLPAYAKKLLRIAHGSPDVSH